LRRDCMEMDIKKVDKGQAKAFLRFDLMLLPLLVRVFYLLGSIVIVLGGLAYPFIHATAMRYSREGFNTGFDFGAFVVGVLISTVMTVLWLLALRIGCELAVVLFKIH